MGLNHMMGSNGIGRNGSAGSEPIAEPGGSGAIIGIDLGTSTSAIAWLNDGRPELIPDSAGDTIIPSVVQLSPDGELIVGTAAKAGAVTFHDRTVQEVKRLMGTGESVKMGGKMYTPEEISTVILSHLKASAEVKLGVGNVRDIVLSVPARFENPAREATKRAAEKAGLNVLRLINEPTAAALSYGLDRLSDQQKVLVFDFGGGTLDVTILEMFEGVLDVKTSVGDDKLGGKDVDDLLIAHFRDLYKEQTKKKLPAPTKDRRISQMLKEEAESCKKRLATDLSTDVEMPYLTPEGGFSATISRTALEDMMEDMLTRAMHLVNEALSRSRLRWEDIDVVLPVGGSSRLPLFRRALELCWGKPIRDYDNPDEAVAKGAAIAAGIEQQAFETKDGAESIMILDVSPHRLGIATIRQVGEKQFIDDYFSELIPKDAKLPAIERRGYSTLFNGSDTINIRIYEATTDENLCRHHRLISEMPLQNAFGQVDHEAVQVEFRYNLDGMLQVSVAYKSAPAIRVGGNFSVLGDGMATEIKPEKLTSRAATAVSSLLLLEKQCEQLLTQAETLQSDNPADAARIRRAADALRLAVGSGQEGEVRQRLDALSGLLFELV